MKITGRIITLMSETDPYKLSFTGASVAVNESVKIAGVLLDLRDWDLVRKKVWAENILQARTRSSIQRTYQELAPRLANLNDDQLELLVGGNLQEQKLLLWFAICKRYTYIQEFAVEVLHEKFLRLDFEITDFNYEAFFNRKADWHDELERLSNTTRIKIKTVLFRMMREASLICDNHRIIPTMLSERLADVLSPDAPMSFQIFPIPKSNIRL